MATPLPSSLPPPELHSRILAALLPQLQLANTSSLRTILQILAYQSLHSSSTATASPSEPLKLALKLSSSPSSTADSGLDVDLLVDLIWAYPNHQNAVSTILTRRFDSDPTLIEHFAETVIPEVLDSVVDSTTIESASIAIKALGGLVRAHDDILSLVVACHSTILSALQGLYGTLTNEGALEIKEEVLLLVERILAGIKTDLHSGLQLLGNKAGRAFVDGTLRTDYEAIFNSHASAEEGIPDEIMGKLRQISDKKAKTNAVLNLASLFPYIPQHLLTEALDHPSYSGSAQSLVEAILGGGLVLPPELRELSRLVMQHQGHDLGVASEQVNGNVNVNEAGTSKPKRTERRNIWQDEDIDMSRLKIKDHSDEAIRSVAGAEIPNHLRDSILRLVEQQAIEAEEQARALAEAQGGPSRGRDTWEMDGEHDDDADVRRVRVAGAGDASGDEDAEGDKDKTVDKTRRPPKEPTYDPEVQIKLELAYLTNPAIFDRGSEIRRSEGRIKLKERTGMDDSQLEGWRVMLERNPHKEAILGRHQVIPPEYQIYLPKAGKGGGKGKAKATSTTTTTTTTEEGTQSREESTRGDGESSRGGGGGGRGGRGGRGGGGGGEGSGGGRGGGGGGGRGRGSNKGSRGHSNAARTRGHDKKMSRMGAGV